MLGATRDEWAFTACIAGLALASVLRPDVAWGWLAFTAGLCVLAVQQGMASVTVTREGIAMQGGALAVALVVIGEASGVYVVLGAFAVGFRGVPVTPGVQRWDDGHPDIVLAGCGPLVFMFPTSLHTSLDTPEPS